MHLFDLAAGLKELPCGAGSERAALGFEHWREAVADADDPAVSAFAEALAGDAAATRLVALVFASSPFLTAAMVADPAFVRDLLTGGPDDARGAVLAGLDPAPARTLDEAGLGRLLRTAKRRISLLAAIADIAGIWPLERVTATLSDFAEAALSLAAGHLLRAAAERGAFTLADADDAERGSGLIVLAMGKLGARELNYSSDIDLIILYDDERISTGTPEALQNHFVRLARGLVRLMDERTAEGYVFRTDLRLRPDPGSTPLAISALAAETYYESIGQNWERAAMIKARPIAGDRAAGAAFLEALRPFVWRKNLDFATIQDIHSIKRQIDAGRAGGESAVAGYNVKLGRGGIREIEFFAQTQQLIWGGRMPELRCRGTIEALRALARAGHVADAAVEDLITAYRFLRGVEHRLQMVNDEQTHTLPHDPAALDDLARFLGYADAGGFGEDLSRHLATVQGHYAGLFNDAPPLGAEGAGAGSLVFTGSDADPETMETLAAMGYGNPGTVDSAVRGWHHARYRAMRSTRSRQLLTELMPVLLRAFAGTSAPDAAFVKFDEFLSRLPAGVQLFSMFHSHPHLLDLVAEIMGGAPRLADHLSRRPSVLDSVLAGDFFDPPPSAAALAAELDRHLERAGNVEDILDASRRWANDRRFQTGVQFLQGLLTPAAAAESLSNIAEAALNGLAPRVSDEFARQHGRIAGGGMAIIALGKLGGGEMTPASDLDLIFVYACDAGAAASDGAKPLSPSHYFARLSQRLINAVNAQTAEGRLYEIDLRLRPSGSDGPIATSFDAFVQYHRDSAWTWEHMALTRARVIGGPDGLCHAIEGAIGETLTRPRDADALLVDVAHMRERMDGEHHTDFIWRVKHLRGGLVDVEFIAQYLQLRHAHAHPEVLSANTRTALCALREAGLVERAAAGELVEALDLWQAIQSMLRLTVEGDLTEARVRDLPAGLKEALARLGGGGGFDRLEDTLRTMAARTHAHFVRLIEAPANIMER